MDKLDILKNMDDYDMNHALYEFKFTEEELERFIDKVSVKCVLKTQHLTMDFVKKYILNEKYQIMDSDKSLVLNDVYMFQPHLRV